MTDLESRLRSYVALDDTDEDRPGIRALMLEAADELAKLREGLDAAVQRERLILGASTMDYLGDMRYTLTSIEGAQAAVDPWIKLISKRFFETP